MREDAASAADGIAESMAESCREDDMKFQAEQQIETANEEIVASWEDIRICRDERTQLRKTCRESHGVSLTVLRERIESNLEDIRKAKKRIETLTDSPWTAVE